METTAGKSFLDGFIDRKMSPEDFSAPEESLLATRNERWPTRWDNRVQGVPSMALASDERRRDYM